jgi:hypothetical protein
LAHKDYYNKVFVGSDFMIPDNQSIRTNKDVSKMLRAWADEIDGWAKEPVQVDKVYMGGDRFAVSLKEGITTPLEGQ